MVAAAADGRRTSFNFCTVKILTDFFPVLCSWSLFWVRHVEFSQKFLRRSSGSPEIFKNFMGVDSFLEQSVGFNLHHPFIS